MKIAVTGDLHLDCFSINKVNQITNVDIRIEDFFKAFDTVIDTCIRDKVDLVVINGDLLKKRTTTFQIEALIAERFKRLSENINKVVVVLGNHDYTAQSLVYNLHAYSVIEKFKLPNVTIHTDLVHITEDDTDIVFYPYYDAKTREGFESNQQIIEFLDNKIKSFNFTKKSRVFIGHGTPEGTNIAEDCYFDLSIVEEPVIPKQVLSSFDICLFSHIHRFHKIAPNIIHVGSIERVDFAESKQDKGFVIYDTSAKKMQWVSTNPRPMLDLKIDIHKEENFNLTSYILEEISKHLKKPEETMIKVQILCNSSQRDYVEMNRLNELLNTCLYHRPIKFTETDDTVNNSSEVEEVVQIEQLSDTQLLKTIINNKTHLTDDQKQNLLSKAHIIMTSSAQDLK